MTKTPSVPYTAEPSVLKPLPSIKGYELRDLIATGGFGAVYRAYQPVVDREVAVKVILPHFADHPDFIRRFEFEARLIARLEHIHIVPLYDFWREPGFAYLVMRWLRGGNLRTSLTTRGAFNAEAASKVLDQISAALSVAHHSNIIHRDLKPDNILLDEYSNAYLADFGIAQDILHDPELKGGPFGTIAYAAPEQLERKPLTAQSDIYSVGILLYELLTGRLPFTSSSDTILMYKQVYEPLPPLERTRSDLAPELTSIIWRATAKNPQDRYQDVLELAADFRRYTSTSVDPIAVPIRPSRTADGNQFATRNLFLGEARNPYKGLRAFTEADAQDFYGRNELIERLISHVKAESFLAVVGPSGSGKSSAVMAGLIPRLRTLPFSQDWFFAQMTPGQSAFQELEAALLRVSSTVPPNLRELLRTDLLDVLEQLLPLKETPLLLFIDQFEELFTGDAAERAQFLSVLASAVNRSGRLKIVLTLRADFYDRPLLYPDFGDLLRQHTEVVLPLSSLEMERVIALPAERQDVWFEDGLIATMVEDVREQPGALPLLQYALTELFERRTNNVIPKSAYEAIGRLSGALSRRADELYVTLDARAQSVAQALFLRLVHIGTEDTRRRAARSELMTLADDKAVIERILDTFGKFRLLTFDHDPATRAPTVEIAHEALVRSWGRLKGWLDTNRDNLRLHQQLTVAVEDWRAAGRDPSYLVTGARLVQFETLLNSSVIPLDGEERNYLDESIAQRRRAALRLRLFITALGVLAVVALTLAVFALIERSRADTEAQISRSRELAVTSLLASEQVDVSLLLSLEAIQAADTLQARSSLLTGLQTHPYLRTLLNGQRGAQNAVDFSPDGRLIASAGTSAVIQLWDMESHQLVGEIETDHTNAINSLDFDPDMQRIVTGGRDGVIRLWDVATGEPLGEPLIGHTDAVQGVVFSPDGLTLASASLDGTVVRWDADTSEPIGEPLASHENWVFSLAYSPDGKVLASGGADNLIRLWDAATGEPIGEPLAGHGNWVTALAYSGTLLASGGADNVIRLWDAETGTPLGFPLTGHQDRVRDLAFSPDGLWLASASNDGTVRVWSVEDAESVIYQGHSGEREARYVASVAYQPDGSGLVSGGGDGRVILWNAPTTPLLASRIIDLEIPIWSLAASDLWFAAAGGGNDFAIRVFDRQTGELRSLLEGHRDQVNSLSVSRDGLRLVSTGSEDATIFVWDVPRRTVIRTIQTGDAVYGVAIHPDGETVAAASDLGVRVWDVESGTLLHTLSETRTYSIAYSPDGETLGWGGADGIIHVWVNEQTSTLEGHTDGVMSLAFTVDAVGRLILASGSRDMTIMLWDTQTGQSLRQPLSGHSGWVTSLSFRTDDRGLLLASGSDDTTVRLWDVATGEPLGQGFIGHRSDVNSVVFSGQTLFSGGLDGRVQLWDTSVTTWLRTACQVANRNLTNDEWRRYFGSTPYRETCGETS